MSENLLVKLNISGTFWDKRPEFQILHNDKIVKSGTIESDSDVIERHEFEIECEEGKNSISLRFCNKTPDQTVKSPDSTDDNLIIEKDMLLNIHEIEIDGIDVPIGADFGADSKYGIYKVDVPVPSYQGKENVTEIAGIKNMGWNGRYELEFNSPFYIWLLETL